MGQTVEGLPWQGSDQRFIAVQLPDCLKGGSSSLYWLFQELLIFSIPDQKIKFNFNLCSTGYFSKRKNFKIFSPKSMINSFFLSLVLDLMEINHESKNQSFYTLLHLLPEFSNWQSENMLKLSNLFHLTFSICLLLDYFCQEF